MNDDVIKGILIEKKRRNRKAARVKYLAGMTLMLMCYTAFAVYMLICVASS